MFEIYLVTNDFNGKKYVGQTTQGTAKRFAQHKHTDSRLGRSIKYHGAEHFKITVIDRADTQEEADKKERQQIKTLDCIRNGYNLKPGGVLDYGEDYESGVGIKPQIMGCKIRFGF